MLGTMSMEASVSLSRVKGGGGSREQRAEWSRGATWGLVHPRKGFGIGWA